MLLVLLTILGVVILIKGPWLKKKVLLPVGVVVFGLTCMAGGALSASSIRTLSAYVNEQIGITIDGRQYIPKEDNGVIVDPLIYNDRTYLPVAKIGEALNVDVDWNAATQSVGIWTEEGQSQRPTKDTDGGGTSSGGSRSGVTVKKPLVSWDDSDAVVKSGMSSYNFDKAFAEIHSLGLTELESSQDDKVHQFIFQAVKEAWNQSPTTHKIKQPAFFNGNIIQVLNDRHQNYKDGTYTALLTLNEELDEEFPILNLKTYKFTGTAIKSVDGGQIYIKVGLTGSVDFKTSGGKVKIDNLVVKETAKLPVDDTKK